MKIVHSVLCGGWGGLEKYPLTVIPGLEERGHTVQLVVLRDSPLAQEAAERKHRLELLPYPRLRRFHPGMIGALRRLAKRERPDVVHCHRSAELSVWVPALVGLPTRVVTTFHIGVPNLRDPLHALLFRAVHRVCAISSENAERMKSRLPIEAKRIVHLPNGVELSLYSQGADEGRKRRAALRSQLGLKPDSFVFATVGRVCEGKGVFDLLQAVARLTDLPVQCVWVGDASFSGDAGIEQRLTTEMAKLGLGERVKFVGSRDDVPAVLGAADAFVLPAHNEAFGLVYVEAMAAGLPVIGCNRGGVCDIIEPEISGLLVPPHSPEELSRAMRRFLTAEGLIDGLRRGGLARATQFSMGSHIAGLEAVYQGGAMACGNSSILED